MPILPVDARVSRVGRRLGYGDAAGDFKKQARSVQDALTARAAGDRSTRTAARSSISRTTAAPRARRAIRTARSVRC